MSYCGFWRGRMLGVPITIVLDDARYQRCALVQSVAQRLGIELLFSPAYSPNLNLIERFWKFVKKQCLYSKYYPDHGCFNKRSSRVLRRPRTSTSKSWQAC